MSSDYYGGIAGELANAGDDRTPGRSTATKPRNTGTWPESWGPYHRHFASDAIHRDGGPECDQAGSPRRVYGFDPDALDAHEAVVTQWAMRQTPEDEDP